MKAIWFCSFGRIGQHYVLDDGQGQECLQRRLVSCFRVEEEESPNRKVGGHESLYAGSLG